MTEHNLGPLQHDGLIEQALRSSNFLREIPFGVVLQNTSGVILDCNANFLELLVVKRDDVVGRTFEESRLSMIREDGQPFGPDDLPAAVALRTGEPCRGVIVGTGRNHGVREWFIVDASPITLETGDTAILSTLTQVTHRIMSRRLLKLHNAMNHTMMSSATEEECLQQMCSHLVDLGGFALAWIGVKSTVTPGGVDIVCSAGRTGYLYEGIVSWFNTQDSGVGPSGTALREGTTQVSQNLSEALNFELWRNRALEYGLGSNVVIPFRYSGHDAMISIYNENINGVDAEMVTGLEEVVRQAQFGIAHQESVRQSQRSLEEVTRANFALQRAERLLIDSKEWYRQVLANSSDVVLVVDHNAQLTYSSPTHTNPTIENLAEQVGGSLFDKIHPEDQDEARNLFQETVLQPGASSSRVLRMTDDRAQWRCFDVLMTNCLDDSIIDGVVINARDVSDSVAARDRLKESQHFLESITNNMIEGLVAEDHHGVVTFANAAAGRLLQWDPSEMIGKDSHETFHSKKRDGSPFPSSECHLRDTWAAKRTVSVELDYFVQRSGSLLPVAYNATPLHAGELSGALYVFEDISAKMAERERVETELEKLAWVGRNRDALDHGRFVLYAQPIVDLATMTPVQHELLIRMVDATGSIVPPVKFLPAAEEFGLIGEIDRWVIDQSLDLALAGNKVEFNLSAKSVADASTLVYIGRRLIETQAPPENLVCEVTETAFMHDMAAAEALVRGLKEMGIHVALDDFGSGYGGFTYLKRLPVSYLKIDREFVKDLKEEESSRHVITTVANLAHAFNLTTIAEGAEDLQTVEILKELGIDHVQGYVLGYPSPVTQVFATPPSTR